jgi:hypothetical protein
VHLLCHKQKWFAAAKKWFVYIQECNAGFVARARFPKTPFYFAQILNKKTPSLLPVEQK